MGRNQQAEKNINAVINQIGTHHCYHYHYRYRYRYRYHDYYHQIEFISLSSSSLARFWIENKNIAHIYEGLKMVDKVYHHRYNNYFCHTIVITFNSIVSIAIIIIIIITITLLLSLLLRLGQLTLHISHMQAIMITIRAICWTSPLSLIRTTVPSLPIQILLSI